MKDDDVQSVLNAEPGVPAAPSVATFTPGPWRIEEHQPKDVRLTRRHWAVGQIYAPARGVALAFGGTEANARLIAAAPELYAALKGISDMLYRRPDMVAALRPMMGPAEHAALDAAGAALAKAEPQTGPVSARTAPNTESSPNTVAVAPGRTPG